MCGCGRAPRANPLPNILLLNFHSQTASCYQRRCVVFRDSEPVSFWLVPAIADVSCAGHTCLAHFCAAGFLPSQNPDIRVAPTKFVPPSNQKITLNNGESGNSSWQDTAC